MTLTPFRTLLFLAAVGAAIPGQATGTEAPNRPEASGKVSASERYVVRKLAREFRESVPYVIEFASGTATLDDAARTRLEAQARWMKRNPDTHFAVTGHAPSPEGDGIDPDLGLARAKAAVAYLVGSGVPLARLDARAGGGAVEDDRTETDVVDVVKMKPVRVEVAGSGF